MKNIRFLSVVAAPLMMLALVLPSHADTTDANVPTTCKDGTLSKATGRGACSGHGGVNSGAAPTAAQSAGATPVETNQGAPAAATGTGSTCKDGSTSTASGRGACSGHGGVQKAPKPTSASAAPTAAVAPAPAAPAAAPAATPQPSGTTSTSSSTATAAAKSPGATTAGSVNSDATGATAKCKDGMFSHSATHTGSCSHHGGVQSFLTPAPH